MNFAAFCDRLLGALSARETLAVCGHCSHLNARGDRLLRYLRRRCRRP
jgi:hypothetical protein